MKSNHCTTQDKYEIVGVESSPYTAKVRAVMRYRHLTHTWLCRAPQFYQPLADIKPLLMPVVRFPDGSHHVDSTPIILALEAAHPGQRSVQPDDPVMAFCSLVIEDMADEWLTKCLFHYRFADKADREFASNWVMDDTYPDIDVSELTAKSRAFLERQTERMAMVGILPENTPVIEASFFRFLDILGPFFALDRFLFGSRPSLADFGLLGQLNTLCSDPTPAAIIRAKAPRSFYWVRRGHDLSGVDGDWQSSRTPNSAVMALLTVAGDTYLPYLSANEKAVTEQRSMFTIDLPNGAYRQRPFRYHVKCLTVLRATFNALLPSDRKRAMPLLNDTGCFEYLVD